MSEPIDDAAFDEYLGRESQVSKRYRALAADEVPAELDSLVLAQAQQAVAVKPASARKKPAWMRWTPPLALAASMVLVISIVIESGTRHEVTMRDVAATMPPSAPVQTAATDSGDLAKQESATLSVQDRPPAAPEPEAAAAPAKKSRQMQPRKKADVAPREEVVTVELKQSVISPQFSAAPVMPEVKNEPPVQSPPPPMEVATPAPAVVTASNLGSAEIRRAGAIRTIESDDSSLSEVTVTSAHRRVQASRSAGPRGTVTSPVVDNQDQEVSEEVLLQQARESDPVRWLEYIRELRRENKNQQADREWRNFLKAYPNHTVDEKDVARARQ